VSAGREAAVSRAFVQLANGMVDGVDVVDLLGTLTTECARLLDIASAGLLLADRHAVLHVVAASSEATRSLELFQLQRDQGPCLDCFHSGTPVSVPDLAAEAARWPAFVGAAQSAGFASLHALPMRLRDNVLGALGLFGTTAGALGDDDLDLGQALAHVASVALVSDRATADHAAVAEQLQSALTSRVLVEQAKGLLAQLGGLEMAQAFEALRHFSRDHNERLTDVAGRVVSRTLPAQQVLSHALSKGELPGA
jgi:transcriptional regulator with GAF, ATPase, and Fis domain